MTPKRIVDCSKCPLHFTRHNIVNGVGNAKSNIVIVGEAPGNNEDIEGVPFIGKAGEILEDLLASIGIHRCEVYITNLVKCRPPGNRNPSEGEINICSEYLEEELDVVNPKIIFTLGAVPTKYILGDKFSSMGKLHGTHIDAGNRIIIPMYHPAYALYNREIIGTMLDDFEKAKEKLK